MNKKFIALAVIVLSALSLTSCGNEKSLVQHGMDMVALMDEMTESQNYLQCYTSDEEILSIIKTLAKGKYSHYDTVYALDFDAETITAMHEILQIDFASVNMHTYLRNQAETTVIPQINGREGAKKLAAASICAAGKTFVYDALEDSVIYLYSFDDTAPIAVIFTPGDDGAVSAQGYFVLADGFTASDITEVEAFFAEYAPTVTVVAGS